MKDADGMQIGWRVACGAYPSSMTTNLVTFRVNANGSARIALSGQEMGQGIRTSIAQAVLKNIDLDPDRLEIVIGDTSAAPRRMTAGSWGSACAIPAAEAAARRMQERLNELLEGRNVQGNAHPESSRRSSAPTWRSSCRIWLPDRKAMQSISCGRPDSSSRGRLIPTSRR